MNWGRFSGGHRAFIRKGGTVAEEERSFALWKEKLLWFGISGVGIIGGWMIRNQLAISDKLNDISIAQAVLTERLSNQSNAVSDVKAQNESVVRAQSIIQAEVDKLNAKVGLN